jgi:hypothetical protein
MGLLRAHDYWNPSRRAGGATDTRSSVHTHHARSDVTTPRRGSAPIATLRRGHKILREWGPHGRGEGTPGPVFTLRGRMRTRRAASRGCAWVASRATFCRDLHSDAREVSETSDAPGEFLNCVPGGSHYPVGTAQEGSGLWHRLLRRPAAPEAASVLSMSVMLGRWGPRTGDRRRRVFVLTMLRRTDGYGASAIARVWMDK